MAGCTKGLEEVQSWYDYFSAPPRDPLELIANATMISGAGTETGAYLNSPAYNQMPYAWTPGNLPVSSLPVCNALGTDSLQMIADASQWTFDHLTLNSSSSLNPAMQRVIFLRGGTQWQMVIPLSLGALLWNPLQLSFIDNSATRGDCHQTIPVISFTLGHTGTAYLLITLHPKFGRYRMGMWAYGTPYVPPPPHQLSMWESDWIVVP